MERNALLAVVISLLILVLWNEFVVKQYMPVEEPVREAATSDAPPPGAAAPDAAPALPDAPPPPGAPAAQIDPAQPAPGQLVGDDVVVETDLFRAVFTTAGARLKSLQLTDYRENTDAGSPPQELVHTAYGAQLPLGLLLRGKGGTLDDTKVLYTVDRDRLSLTGESSGALTFKGNLDGTEVTKRIELDGHRYLWAVDVRVANPPAFVSEMAITWNASLDAAGGWGQGVQPTANPHNAILALEADDLQTMTRDDLAEGRPLEGAVDWIGFSGQYFFSGLIPDTADDEPSTAKAWAVSRGENAQAMLRLPGAKSEARITVFTGPKDIDLLDRAGHSLRRALDLGWFTIVALPMLQFLRFLYQFTGNHGVDIILLTILIKILFYPLTKKSFQSMKAMQKLQPEMERLRESYKDKPDQMNQAVMELYKKHKVNPLGGCLPMFLQLPVFIGLYNALLNAVELRHAPFVGWIQDLSAPDRLGDFQLPFVTGAGIPILTLIMGASMLVQQKMTPTTTADPTQQRMMMLMPVVFTFMFINFPAGLTLYWLVNNVLTIGQQYMINRQPD